jgi:HPt (histidine-containing phosphotransfer) domain-containing protein
MLDGLAGGSHPPLDLVHLTRQCFGDQELEAELLALFEAQAPALAAQLIDSGPLALEARARIAHTLRGSALAIGAWRLAGVAARIEDLAPVGGRESENGEVISELLSAVAEVLAEIERIRG